MQTKISAEPEYDHRTGFGENGFTDAIVQAENKKGRHCCRPVSMLAIITNLNELKSSRCCSGKVTKSRMERVLYQRIPVSVGVV